MTKENPSEDTRKEQVLNRCSTLVALYQEFINKYNDPHRGSVYLNKDLLYIVVESYFDDIYRYKEYSGSERADQHKQAGYTIKWISRIRPIQLNQDTLIDKQTLFINSSFAIYCGFSFLDLKIADTITPHFFKHLLYITQYRQLSGKQLATMFYVLECGAKNINP